MNTEHSTCIVERSVPVPVTGASIHLDLAALADHGDGGPVGADRHLPTHVEAALLTVLTEIFNNLVLFI